MMKTLSAPAIGPMFQHSTKYGAELRPHVESRGAGRESNLENHGLRSGS